MLIVRPVSHHDLSGIEKLVTAPDAVLSTLSNQRDHLSQRIEDSMLSFSGDRSRTGKERFLFVLEDVSLESNSLVGVAGIDACAGNGTPFYNYRKDELLHASHSLEIHNRVPVLYMTHELTGRSQLCSLNIRADYKLGNSLELLSRARLLFVGIFREYFSRELVVEMQGQHDELGQSPFWDSLGRHFFGMDFKSASYYSAIKTKTFIAELMPSHPIYVPLLTPAAQAAIGKPSSAVAAGYQVLLREGFRTSKHVDIFDAGPTLIARLDDLNILNHYHYKFFQSSENSVRGAKYIVCNPSLNEFRCAISYVEESDDTVALAPELINALRLQEDDRIAVVAF